MVQLPKIIKHNYLWLIVYMIMLILLMLLILDGKNYQDKCNEHWQSQWQAHFKGFLEEPTEYNTSYKLGEGIINGNKDQDQNTKRPS